MGIKKIILSFFASKMNAQVKELYSANLIFNFALSAILIFEPVFIYLLFIDSYDMVTTLKFILYFYLIVYVVYFFILPLGAKFAQKFGYEHAMAVGSVFTILVYLLLFAASQYLWLLGLSAVMYALAKTFYWPGYHGDFAQFSTSGEHGRQISNLIALNAFVAIVGPLFGGLVLKFFGYPTLFVVVAIVVLLSNVPMLITREIFIPSSFDYFASYRRIFKKKNRQAFLAHMGFGEELILLSIWPVFIYVIVEDFLQLGFFVSISTLITTVVFLYIGRLADKAGDGWVLRLGSILYFFSWLFKLIVRGAVGVFLVDAFTRMSKQGVSIPFIAMTYEKAQSTSVMKTIIFFEMSLIVAKIIAIVLSLMLLEIFAPGWNAMFILAAVMTLFYPLLHNKPDVKS